MWSQRQALSPKNQDFWQADLVLEQLGGPSAIDPRVMALLE